MSFFGFDPTAPPGARPAEQAVSHDFQDTYDGLGELEDGDDIYNNETFGVAGSVGKDFNFGTASGHVQLGAAGGSQNAVVGVGAPVQSPLPAPQTISYAQAAAQSNDDEFMADLWGSNAPAQTSTDAVVGAIAGEKKILSLEEIESQLTSIDQQQRQHPQQPSQFVPQPFAYPGMMAPPQYGGYMVPPGGFMPPPPGQYAPQFPIMQGLPSQLPPQLQQPIPQHVPGIQQPQSQSQPQPQPQPQLPQSQSQPQPQPQEQQSQQLQQLQQPVRVSNVANVVPAKNQNQSQQQYQQKCSAKADLSQFPVLGSKEVERQHQSPHQQSSDDSQFQSQSQSQKSQQPLPAQSQEFNQFHRDNRHHGHHHHHQQQDLTPEQQERAARRQEKVSRIMRYSGIMNPKDKDFVTRFQLSQIVTEDPYNEDFYAQVYKVIHPKNSSLQQTSQQHNSIAQAYLEQSGHRLGGRYKRADVALQRMQQQVQKAVTVAKERPKLTQYAREGALGKISFGTGKKPRQQLEIISKAAQRKLEKEKKELEGGDSISEEASEETVAKKNRSPSISAPRVIKKYSKKDIMSILEGIITELMNVESESRTNANVDTTQLWESLRVLEQSTSFGEDEEVNPFIQCLNFNKGLKILSRLFKFLSREQVLTIVTLIMSNLENLSVIKNGSYTTYGTKKVPETIVKLVEVYSMTFSKVLMNAVLDFKFNEIIGLIVILIEHNNVAYVSTTKIGLTILTTLLSRAELIIGEGTISATDLSEWSSCYDELFTSLESRIAAIFPPHPEDIDDGSSRENYVWQFLATLSLGGKLNHQRIIVDEVRDEIFGVMSRAKAINDADADNLYKKSNLLNNLNMYLVVMGLVADETEIKELQN